MSENLLEGIQKLTTGQQAALRREAGKRMSEANAASLQAFYSAMPTQRPCRRFIPLCRPIRRCIVRKDCTP